LIGRPLSRRAPTRAEPRSVSVLGGILPRSVRGLRRVDKRSRRATTMSVEPPHPTDGEVRLRDRRNERDDLRSVGSATKAATSIPGRGTLAQGAFIHLKKMNPWCVFSGMTSAIEPNQFFASSNDVYLGPSRSRPRLRCLPPVAPVPSAAPGQPGRG